MSLYQRSGDVGLGVPFNTASYSFLTHLIAFHCGLKAHEFCYHLGNCHIYDDHIEQLKIQRNKEPYKFPKLVIKDKKDDIKVGNKSSAILIFEAIRQRNFK